MNIKLIRISLLLLCLFIPHIIQTYDFGGGTSPTPSTSTQSVHDEQQPGLEPVERAAEPAAPPTYMPDQATIIRLQQRIDALERNLAAVIPPPSYATAQATPPTNIVRAAWASAASAAAGNIQPAAPAPIVAPAAQARGNPYVTHSATSSTSQVPSHNSDNQTEQDEELPCRKRVCPPALKCFKTTRSICEYCCFSDDCTECYVYNGTRNGQTRCWSCCYTRPAETDDSLEIDSSWSGCVKCLSNFCSFWCCSKDCEPYVQSYYFCCICCVCSKKESLEEANKGRRNYDHRCFSCCCNRPKDAEGCDNHYINCIERSGHACERACFSQGCIKPTGEDDDALCCSYFCDKT